MTDKSYWWTNKPESRSLVKFVEAGSDLVLNYNVSSDDSGSAAPLANVTVTLITSAEGGTFSGQKTGVTDAQGNVQFTLTSTLSNDDAEPRPTPPSSMSYWDDSRGGFAEKKFNITPTIGAGNEDIDRVWTHTVKQDGAPPASEFTIRLSDADTATMTNKSYWWTNEPASRSWVKFVQQGGTLDLHYTVTDKNGNAVANQALTLNSTSIGGGAFNCTTSTVTDADGAATFSCTNTNAPGEGEPYPSAPSSMDYWDDSRAISHAVEVDFTPTTGIAGAIEHIDRVWTHIVKENVTEPTTANIRLSDADKSMMTDKSYWWTNEAQSYSLVKMVDAGGWLNLHYTVTDGNGEPMAGRTVTLNTNSNGRASFGGATTGVTDADGKVTFRFHNDTSNDDAEPRPVAPSSKNYWDDSRGGTLNGLESKFDFTPTVGADIEHLDRVWTHTIKAMSEATFRLSEDNKSTMTDKSYWWTNEAASHSLVKFVTAGDTLTLDYTVTDENGNPASDTEVVLNGGGSASFEGPFPKYGTTDADGKVTFVLKNTTNDGDAEPRPTPPSSMSYWDDSRGVTREANFNFEPTVIGVGATHVDRVWTHTVKAESNVTATTAYIRLSDENTSHMTNKSYWWTNEPQSRSWVKMVEAGSNLVLNYRVTDGGGLPIAFTTVTLYTSPGGATFSGDLTGVTDADGYVTFTLRNETPNNAAEPRPTGASNMDYWDDSRGGELNGYEVKYDFWPSIGADTEHIDRVWTHTVQAEPTAPGNPTDLMVTPGDDSLHVSFTATDGNSEITSTTITVRWAVNKKGTAVRGKTFVLDGFVTDYDIDGLTNGLAYTVWVRVTNAVGSSAAVASKKVYAGAPMAPSIDEIVAGNGKLTINFTPGDDGAAATRSFGVSLDGGLTWNDSRSFRGSPIVIKRLDNGTTYNVMLRQWNKYGVSAASEAVDAAPIADLPSAPRMGRVTATADTITVNFRAGKNGGAEITDYEYSLDGGDTWTSAGSTDSPLEISGVDSETGYQVAIRAVNSTGSGASSAVRSVMTKVAR